MGFLKEFYEILMGFVVLMLVPCYIYIYDLSMGLDFCGVPMGFP